MSNTNTKKYLHWDVKPLYSFLFTNPWVAPAPAQVVANASWKKQNQRLKLRVSDECLDYIIKNGWFSGSI